jgi:hypothetical protein
MVPRKQMDDIFDEIITTDWVKDSEVVTKIIQEYEKLNEKCDRVILKIKERKQRQKKI